MTAPKRPTSSRSAVFDRTSSPRSLVAGNDRPWGFIAGLGGIAVLAAIVFFSLSQSRSADAQTAAPPQAASVPPPSNSLFLVPPPRPLQAQSPPSLPPGLEPTTQWGAPAMVVDLSDAEPLSSPTSASGTPAASHGNQGSGADAAGPGKTTSGSGFADDPFAAHVSSAQTDTVYASHLRDVALIVPQGTVIPAILETGINSDLPGFVRAVVSRDVHGFDGSTVLIPRGSKLIGQYRNAVAAGASRAFVVWSRLLTPEGISIDIGSPAADQLGHGGLKGETNSHFFQRFGAAILLSVLTTGMEALANDNTNGNTAIVIGSPQQASNVATIALQKDIDIPTTITVAQGTPMRVFVARDLDFSGVVQRKP